MQHFICPVCSEALLLEDRTYRCVNNHCFDCAKSGYVNLLRSQKSSDKRHGDDKLMIRARTAFLEKGFYKPLLKGILKECDKLSAPALHIVDIGCGEGWYTQAVYEHLSSRRLQMEGIDISKDALAFAAKRNKDIAYAVASISALPIQSESVDLLLNLFAPFDEKEYARILKKDGIWLKAIPLERHLYGLKAAIYDRPYENEVSGDVPSGFRQVDYTEIKETLTLTDGEDIRNLFRMTPYYYKTSAKDQEKVDGLTRLTTPIEFALIKYQKTGE